MKKEEFLKELEQRLHILNESECGDILGEYSQHIDMKMEAGMDEEAATREFGDIKVLADEILSAYNVNLRYNRPNLAAKSAGAIGKARKLIYKKLGRCRSTFVGILKWIGRKSTAVLNIIWPEEAESPEGKRKRSKAALKGGCDEMSDMNLEVQKSENSRCEYKEQEKQKKYELHEMGRSVGLGITHMACKIGGGVAFLCRLCFLMGALLLSLPFIVVACAFLLCLGVVIVLVPQGYPLIGIAIMLLGGFVCAFSVSGVLLSLCVKKKSMAATAEDSNGIEVVFNGMGDEKSFSGLEKSKALNIEKWEAGI